jgi:hypothetical protein
MQARTTIGFDIAKSSSGLSEIALPVGLVFDRSARVEIVARIPV